MDFDVGVGGPGTNPLQITKDSCTDKFTHQATEPEPAFVLSKYLGEKQREGLVSCFTLAWFIFSMTQC